LSFGDVKKVLLAVLRDVERHKTCDDPTDHVQAERGNEPIPSRDKQKPVLEEVREEEEEPTDAVDLNADDTKEAIGEEADADEAREALRPSQ